MKEQERLSKFNLTEGMEEKEFGIALACSPEYRRELLETARTIAIGIAARNHTVTYDDVFAEMKKRGLNPLDLGNAAGSVFRTNYFTFSGEWHNSERVSNHAHTQRRWKLTREKETKMAQLNFNAFDHDPTQGGSVLFPLADYQVEITAADVKPTKNNPEKSGLLELTLTIIAGDARGLSQAHRLNIFNESPVARQIAERELSAICFAINRPYIQDSAQLLGGRMIATIGPQDDNPKYSEVKTIKCLDGTLPTKPAQAQQGQAVQVNGAAAAAPPAPAAANPPAAQPQPQWTSGAAPQTPWNPGAPPAPAPAANPIPPWMKQ